MPSLKSVDRHVFVKEVGQARGRWRIEIGQNSDDRILTWVHTKLAIHSWSAATMAEALACGSSEIIMPKPYPSPGGI